MDVRYLQSFIAVVDCGSLAEAARRLDLTAAAIAARIRALEEDLGTPLIRRAGRVVKPTEAGLQILEQGRHVLESVQELRRVVEAGTVPGELRVGCFISAVQTVLPSVLKRLYAAHPDLSVFVQPGWSPDLCQRVVAGELDAALVVEHQFEMPKSCEWQDLLEDPFVVVAPKALAGRDPHEILSTAPFIRYDRRVWGGRTADRYLRDHSIQPRQRLEIDGLTAIVALVNAGLGVSLLPDWAPLWAARDGLVRIPLPGRAPVRRVGMVWASLGPRAALARALVREAQTVLGQRETGTATGCVAIVAPRRQMAVDVDRFQ